MSHSVQATEHEMNMSEKFQNLILYGFVINFFKI
jgi:hypothetical protein